MNQNDPVTNMLHNTDDPSVWAEEFCRLFHGKIVTILESREEVDPGLMIGWFANAMMVAINHYERRKLHAKDELRNVFEGTTNDDPS